MSERLAEEVFRTASESIEVLTTPYEAVVERAREQRRRRWRAIAAGVAAAVVVAGLTTWVATRPAPPPEPVPTHVVPMRNPVGTAWYAGGRLHLRTVAVDIPDVTDVASVGDGVVYLDRDGEVGLVSASGDRTIVGSAVPGSTVLGSGEDDWAVWLHPEESGVRLVVWSVRLDEVLASMVVSPETQLIAIDQDRVYTQADAGAFSWQAGVAGARPVPLGPPQLADVGSATRVYQRGHRIEMVQPFFSVSFVRRGDGATVSPGGNYVLSRRPGPWEPGSPFEPLIYDTRSGARLPSGIAGDERAIDAVFGTNHDVTYLVAKAADLADVDLDGGRVGLLVLRTCELEAAGCHDVAPVPSSGGRAMFAR